MYQGSVIFWKSEDVPVVVCHSESGETFAWRGGDSHQVRRAVGYEASDLQTSFGWSDAAATNEVIRRHWPEPTHCNPCECYACRERRDRDSEMMEQAKVKKKPKRDWLVIVFFAAVIWRRRVRIAGQWIRGLVR